ncbi:MAG: helix-turn-helix transcriptional regulator [Lachnospiraceae bacterium]|nr:helix-turn-helix transcriptional regulator [Lachnospiraceae bacterium]
MEKEKGYSQVTQDVLSYIEENSPDRLSLAEIAGDRNWNIDHMIRSFKRDTGLTPHKYITRVKADFAISFISQGMNLQDIADRLGYSSVSSLSAAFKNVTKRNLSEYKSRQARS